MIKYICEKGRELMIEKLASASGRNDEEPNIELACELCESEDREGIKEIAEGLTGKDKAVANDCIKVLYEIGERKPELIADYVEEFVSLLLSKNNRIAWGAMTALASIAELRPAEIFQKISNVKKAYKTGSVITVDNSITVFAKLCRAGAEYEKELFPLLTEHLRSCRPKETAQHAERMFLCVNDKNSVEYIAALESRRSDLTAAQQKRIDKLLKQLKQAEK